MSHFTPEQLQELEARYGLKPVKEMLPVRDGSVAIDGKVWWRGEDGPELVDLSKPTDYKAHISNLRDFPKCYQLKKPKTTITYLD